jgi:hypothetical protein
VRDDAEVIGDFVAKVAPVFWDGFAEEVQDGVGELLLPGIETVMRDMGVHDGPEALDGVQVRAIGGQLDQVDAAIGARQPVPDGFAAMIRRVCVFWGDPATCTDSIRPPIPI